jgi:hypothetical protein
VVLRNLADYHALGLQFVNGTAVSTHVDIAKLLHPMLPSPLNISGVGGRAMESNWK